MSERVGGVRRGRGGPQVPGAGEAESDWRADGRRRRGLTGPVALAISGLVLYLAWSALWERSHPAGAAARGVREGDTAARLQALRDLERLGPQDPDVALPALIEGLADPDAANRAAAIAGLVSVIHGVAGSSSDRGQVGEAITALMARLKDGDAGVRARSAQALWTIYLIWQDPPRMIAPDVLAAAMKETADDPDAQVRTAAIRGLGVVGRRLSDDPPPRLVAALEDDSTAVGFEAAQALAMYRRGLVRLLPKLVESLEATRAERRPAYLFLISQVSSSLTLSLKVPAEEVIGALVPALASRDREVRLVVARKLGEFGPAAREAIPALVALLGDPDEGGSAQPTKGPLEWGTIPHGRVLDQERDLAVVAAAMLVRVAGNEAGRGDAGDVPRHVAAVAGLKQLLGSQDARRRAAAAAALGSFDPDAAVVSALSEAVDDRDATVRVAALCTLHDHAFRRKIAAPRAIAEALEHGDPAVRGAAAWALEAIQLGVEPMVPALIRHGGQDPDHEVRVACASALQGMYPPRVAAAVLPMYLESIQSRESPPALRRSLIEALSGFGAAANGAIPAIMRVLRSDSGEAGRQAEEWIEVRGSAARALGRLASGSPSCAEAAVALMNAVDDPAVGVRSTAVEALVKIGPAAREVIPALLPLMRRARDQRSAMKAVAIADAARAVAPGTPEEAQILAMLMELLGAEPDLQSVPSLIDAVARFGPRAAGELPRIRELEGSTYPFVRNAARKAVDAIEASNR